MKCWLRAIRKAGLRQHGSARMTAVAAATMWEPGSDGQPAPLDLDLKLGELGCDRAPRPARVAV